jgi:hypothetical protein
MKQLSREHQAVFNFKNAVAQFRPVVTDQESMPFTRFFDSFEGAISNFIQTELFIRQGERCARLNVFPDLKNFSLNYGNQLNVQGIDYLNISKTFLQEFRNSLSNEPVTDAAFQQVLNGYFVNINETLSQIEVKASDAAELSAKFRTVLDTLATGSSGLKLIDYLILQVRSTPGRGAETNIAIWKLVAAAALLALGAWVVYKCYYSRWRCSKREQAIYNSILTVAMITFGACE